MNYDTMTDRELDAAVAEKVMGWRWYRDMMNPARIVLSKPEYGIDVTGRFVETAVRQTGEVFDGGLASSFSTSIADAWQVKAKMNSMGWHISAHDMVDDDLVLVQFHAINPDRLHTCLHKSICRAICIAALKAVEVMK